MDITKSLIHELLPDGIADLTSQFLLGDKSRKLLTDILTQSDMVRSELFGVLANMAVTDGYGMQTLGVFKALEELRDEDGFKRHFTIGDGVASSEGQVDYTYFAPNAVASVCFEDSVKGFVIVSGTQNMLFSKGMRNRIALNPIWQALAVVRGDGNRIDSIGDFSVIKVSGNDNEITLTRGGVVSVEGAGNVLTMTGLDHIHLGLYFKASVGTEIRLIDGTRCEVRSKEESLGKLFSPLFEPDTWYCRAYDGRFVKADKLPLMA